jgi:predicted double-glycine peptidase
VGHQSTDTLKPAVDAYNKGNYREAEAAARKIIDANTGSKNPAKRRKSVEARYVLAFSAARRKQMSQARDRFADMKKEAATLPDKGKQAPLPGTVRPTLEEDAAYQHAVCTAAMGDKKTAEAEYMAFIRDYPESPLTGAAVERIRRLHGGHTVRAAEEAWKKSSLIARARDEQRRKEQEMAMSKCGPECLSEFLRRRGKSVSSNTLAKELKTSTGGTSLLSIVRVAKAHGLNAKGYTLSDKALGKQPLPMISLIRPGHYVVVDKVTADSVSIWDPFGKGIGRPGVKTYKMSEWQNIWSRAAMVVAKTTPAAAD